MRNRCGFCLTDFEHTLIEKNKLYCGPDVGESMIFQVFTHKKPSDKKTNYLETGDLMVECNLIDQSTLHYSSKNGLRRSLCFKTIMKIEVVDNKRTYFCNYGFLEEEFDKFIFTLELL